MGRAGVEPATLCLKVREYCVLQMFIGYVVSFNSLIIEAKNVNPLALSSEPQGSKRVAGYERRWKAYSDEGQGGLQPGEWHETAQREGRRLF